MGVPAFTTPQPLSCVSQWTLEKTVNVGVRAVQFGMAV
jgi:hypothetical protein